MNAKIEELRSFLVLTQERHFGRAAARLFLTQQALSKRIQRLEAALGARLLVRDSRGVELTDAGRRVLPHARRLVEDADELAATLRSDPRMLRVDVWGQVQLPLRLMRAVAGRMPDLVIDLGMRRGLPASLRALARGEIDLAFGRVQDLGAALPADFAHRLVALEPAGAGLARNDPLCAYPTITAADLADHRLWCPLMPGAPEVTAHYRRFAERFGFECLSAPANLGLEHALAELGTSASTFTLLGAEWPVPAETGVAVVPLAPAPLFPWSAIWHAGDRSRSLAAVLDHLVEMNRSADLLSYDPDCHWLPDVDLPDLRMTAIARPDGGQ